MRKFFAAALLSAAIFTAGPVYAEALPKAPPSSISLPGGESVRRSGAASCSRHGELDGRE